MGIVPRRRRLYPKVGIEKEQLYPAVALVFLIVLRARIHVVLGIIEREQFTATVGRDLDLSIQERSAIQPHVLFNQLAPRERVT